jgi:hypothetical protein
MDWENVLKVRDIKIPKKRKQDKVDTSKFYSRPAQKKNKEKTKTEPFQYTPTPRGKRKFSNFKGKSLNIKERADKVKNRIQELKKVIEDLPLIQRHHNSETLLEIERDIDELIERTKRPKKDDTFEKEAGGVSFGGHGANPELFNISYGKKRRKKDGKEGK